MKFCVAWMLYEWYEISLQPSAHIRCADSVRVLGLRKRELTNIEHATLEAKKVSCKPRVVRLELPPAPLGTSYYPQCITAKRCGGCCHSTMLECRPINTTTVKKWVSTAVSLHNYSNCPMRSSALTASSVLHGLSLICSSLRDLRF